MPAIWRAGGQPEVNSSDINHQRTLVLELINTRTGGPEMSLLGPKLGLIEQATLCRPKQVVATPSTGLRKHPEGEHKPNTGSLLITPVLESTCSL